VRPVTTYLKDIKSLKEGDLCYETQAVAPSQNISPSNVGGINLPNAKTPSLKSKTTVISSVARATASPIAAASDLKTASPSHQGPDPNPQAQR